MARINGVQIIQLVDSKVKVTISCDAHGVDPVDPRVSDKNRRECRVWIVHGNSILFDLAAVYDSISVAFKAVADQTDLVEEWLSDPCEPQPSKTDAKQISAVLANMPRQPHTALP